MKIPPPTNTIQNLVDKYHEANAEPPRPHMGASTLGHPCDRWLWLSFRWAVIPKHSGRILRLFRRGKLEEAQILADLRAIGMEIDSDQMAVTFGSHVSGSLDAIVISGEPELPKTKYVAEFKTHSAKSFKELQTKGLEKAKPEHYVQMQVYMLGTSIWNGLYIAVCKDDDQIYTERVKYDQAVAVKAIARGQWLALENRMPPPLSVDPSWYQCKFCSGYEFCHQTRMTREVNCRTCAHSTPKPDGTWLCERFGGDIPLDFQRTGCESHVLHPDLVPWKRKDSSDRWSVIYVINEKEVTNGEPDANIYASKELVKGSWEK